MALGQIVTKQSIILPGKADIVPENVSYRLRVPGYKFTIQEIVSKFPTTREALYMLIGLNSVVSARREVGSNNGGTWETYTEDILAAIPKYPRISYPDKYQLADKKAFYTEVIRRIVTETTGREGNFNFPSKNFQIKSSRGRYGNHSIRIYVYSMAFPKTFQQLLRVSSAARNKYTASLSVGRQYLSAGLGPIISQISQYPASRSYFFQAQSIYEDFTFKWMGKRGANLNKLKPFEIGISYTDQLPPIEEIEWSMIGIWQKLFTKTAIGKALLKASASKLRGAAGLRIDSLIPPPPDVSTKVEADKITYYYVFNDFVFYVANAMDGPPKIWIEYRRGMETAIIEIKKKAAWKTILHTAIGIFVAVVGAYAVYGIYTTFAAKVAAAKVAAAKAGATAVKGTAVTSISGTTSTPGAFTALNPSAMGTVKASVPKSLLSKIGVGALKFTSPAMKAYGAIEKIKLEQELLKSAQGVSQPTGEELMFASMPLVPVAKKKDIGIKEVGIGAAVLVIGYILIQQRG